MRLISLYDDRSVACSVPPSGRASLSRNLSSMALSSSPTSHSSMNPAQIQIVVRWCHITDHEEARVNYG